MIAHKDYRKELVETVRKLCQPGKGILAADESHTTIGKKVNKNNS
jgi:fructose-bisphosphate aldolase class 1